VKNSLTEYRTMTRKNGDRSLAEIKALLEEESDFLRPMVRAVIQEFLEAEMASARKRASESKGDLATAAAITPAAWSPEWASSN
jgi:hypothetical protein